MWSSHLLLDKTLKITHQKKKTAVQLIYLLKDVAKLGFTLEMTQGDGRDLKKVQ